MSVFFRGSSTTKPSGGSGWVQRPITTAKATGIKLPNAEKRVLSLFKNIFIGEVSDAESNHIAAIIRGEASLAVANKDVSMVLLSHVHLHSHLY